MATIALSPPTTERPLLPVLAALSGAHLLNDLLQSMIPAIYPLIKDRYGLDFAQVGLITLAFQVTSSLLQPLIGHLTDRRPWPYAMVAGMVATLCGVLGLAFAGSYASILACAALVGTGSAVFHPEATRMARFAAAGRQGLAQGVFQIGGHVGYSVGPLLAAAVVVPRGQASLSWFSGVALIAMVLMAWTASRFVHSGVARPKASARAPDRIEGGHGRARIAFAMGLLVVLLVSKNAYSASFTSFYTFYLIERFDVTVQHSQLLLFLYLVVGAAGVVIGGMVGDRIGRDRVIWISILGALPFALLLPYAGLTGTVVLGVLANFIMSSAFSAILIYAIDLVPNRVGLVGGLFYGLSFGLGGLCAAGLGILADRIGITGVFQICSWLPAVGLMTFLLPRATPKA